MTCRARNAGFTGIVVTLLPAAGLLASADDAPRQRVRVVELRQRDEKGLAQSQAPAEARDGWLDFDARGTPYPRVVVRERRYDWNHYRRRPYLLRRYLPYGYGYFGGIDPFAVQRALEEAYYAGRLDERQDRQRRFNRRDMARRQARLLDKHEQVLRAGLERLKAGDYARAAIGLTFAAKLNHGDPACRVHLAQTRLALGQYREAAAVLRRALQLQPKLVYVDLKLDSYYPRPGKLAACAEALAEWMKHNRADANVYFLRGFLEFQRGNFAQAYEAFRSVARVMPRDPLTLAYLEVAKPAAR